MYRVLGPLALVWCATGSLCWPLAARAAEPNETQSAYPLRDGRESAEQYAMRVNLPPTKTLDLGGGVTMEFVLIPAGKFTMGTPEPVPVDEVSFRTKSIVGQAVCAVGVGVLLVLIGTVIVRAIRQRHRPQDSLARFLAMTVAAGVGVVGGTYWWHSMRTLAQARAEHTAALARYRTSSADERPAHEVTLTTPFYISRQEVTQEQYAQVTGTNPSRFKGPSLPVETVSWNDAQEFCKRATAVPHSAGLRNQQSGKVLYRLPTEAEWEFACRAGTTTTYYTGDAEADLGRAAWYGANSKNTTHPVGQKEPNAFGLHDTHGNVFEWCLDHWQGKYSPEAAVDPQGPPEGQYRVLRGGSWFGDLGDCRSASRTWGTPGFRDGVVGFRVVASAPHGNDGR